MGYQTLKQKNLILSHSKWMRVKVQGSL
jgi:hypothetical protein